MISPFRLSSHLPRMAVVFHDLLMVALTWQGLFTFRHVLAGLPVPVGAGGRTMLLVLVVQSLVFWWGGLYRGLWRFASVADLGNILKASLLGTVALILCLAWTRFEGIPLSVLVCYPFVLTLLLGVPRLLYRTWSDYRDQRREQACERLLILGAGVLASVLIRELRRSGKYDPIGLLDDAPQLKGARLLGVPVLGSLNQVPQIARQTAATMLVIAIPTLDRENFARVMALCKRTGLPCRIAPSMEDVLAGRQASLKEVAIEDLLGRQPVEPDWARIRGWLKGRTILVTGAGGSIGSELCRQCAAQGAGRIVLVDQSELSLLKIEQELRQRYPALALTVVLGDCGDRAVIDHALAGSGVDALFHAAAYKHVPVLEAQVREAVRNNVLSTQTVAEAAIAAKVSHFVLISTDKAVNPVNALGASKRCAEMVCQVLGQEQGTTRFVTVRFGNVLDSAGSVVPLFREQIARGGPVTVTDPDVTRYFMTIPESCQLILQAASSSTGGRVYTLDMGESIRIADLAEQMIRLAGKVPGRDIAIVYTGLRPGEKLHETLFYANESHAPTSHPKVMEASWQPLSSATVLGCTREMAEACRAYDVSTLRTCLGMMVPDYARSQHLPLRGNNVLDGDGGKTARDADQRDDGHRGNVVSLASWAGRTGESR